MKKILFLFTASIILFSAKAQVKVCALPTTTVSATGDWLIKEDASCTAGTKKIDVGHFISSNNILTSGTYTGTVPFGGTGKNSFAAYSVICGGTTSTGALQNVSGVGTAGQCLKSNGGGVLPTWQDLFNISALPSSTVTTTADILIKTVATTSVTSKSTVAQFFNMPTANFDWNLLWMRLNFGALTLEGGGAYNFHTTGSGSETYDSQYTLSSVALTTISSPSISISGSSVRLPNAGTAGLNKVLTSDANGYATWVLPAIQTPSLTDTYVGVGSGSNSLSGSTALTFTNNILRLNNSDNTGYSALDFGSNFTSRLVRYGSSYASTFFGASFANSTWLGDGVSPIYLQGNTMEFVAGQNSTDLNVRIDNSGLKIGTNATSSVSATSALDIGTGYLHAKGITLNGASSGNYIDIIGNGTMTAPGSGTRIYGGTTGNLNIYSSYGYKAEFAFTGMNADRTYTMPDASVVLVGDNNTQTLSNKNLGSCIATTQSAGDNSTKLATTAYVDKGIKEYVALVSQTGTLVPTATVIKNDIGAITWSYDGVGNYSLNCAACFTNNKTIVTYSQSVNASAWLVSSNTGSYTPNQVGIFTEDILGFTYANDVLNANSIIIRVYP